MPEVELENMGVGGILRDKEAHTLAPEYWSGGKNVRFLNGEAVKILGEEEVYPSWAMGALLATGTNENFIASVIDSSKDFVALSVQIGDIVQNEDTGAWGSITLVTTTHLVLNAVIFPSVGATYNVYALGAAATPPLWLLPWRDATATGYWLAPTEDAILRFTSSTLLDVTRASGAYTGDGETIWSGGVLGGIPILNNDAGDDPQGWDSGTSLFVDLPNWPAATSCKIMRVFKQFAIAYDITVSSVRHPHRVKWSSPATPGSVPSFWDNANSNDSNEFDLSEGGGFVTDAEVLGDINMIYKEEKTYGMQHVGGEFVFRIYELPFKTGIFAPRCAKTVQGRACVITKDDIILHNGQEAVSIIDSFNRNYLFDNIAPGKERRTFMVPNYAYNEIWICFVSYGVDGDYADEALVWNYKDKTWGHKVLNNVTHIGYGLLDKTSKSPLIDDQIHIINADSNLIDGSVFSSAKLRLLGVQESTTNSRFVEYDTGTTNIGTSMESHVERTGITIVGKDRQGQPKVSNFTTKMVQRIYPKIESTGPVDVYVGYQQRLEGSVNYSGPFSFNPLTDNHIDVRLQGKAICLKIASSTDIEWSATGATFEMTVLGGSLR